MATLSSILAWRSPWTEELVSHSPWGHKESDTIECLYHVVILSVSFWGTSMLFSITSVARFYVVVESLSRVWLFTTPRTVARQDPLSVGFPRQEYWRRWPFPSLGVFLNPCLLHCMWILYRWTPGEAPFKFLYMELFSTHCFVWLFSSVLCSSISVAIFLTDIQVCKKLYLLFICLYFIFSHIF